MVIIRVQENIMSARELEDFKAKEMEGVENALEEKLVQAIKDLNLIMIKEISQRILNIERKKMVQPYYAGKL